MFTRSVRHVADRFLLTPLGLIMRPAPPRPLDAPPRHRRPPTRQRQHRTTPSLSTALVFENLRIKALLYQRVAARAAASDAARMRLHARMPPPPPPSAAMLVRSSSASIPCSTSRPCSAPTRAPPISAWGDLLAGKLGLEIEAAERAELACSAIQRVAANQRTSWGFFTSALSVDQRDNAPLLRIGAPAINGAQQLPDMMLARPVGAEEKRLQFGPFAFRLSPSSEVLAWLLATRLRPKLKGKRVLEVGSGLGLTGLACAAWCECESVELTDGDPQAVTLLHRNAALNRGRYGTTTVEVALLLWGLTAANRHVASTSSTRPAARQEDAMDQLYDVILCADCVYDRELHRPLCQTLRRCLRPNGVVFLVASRRCGSLGDFEQCCRQDFYVRNWGSAYDELVSARFGHAKCSPSVLCLTLRV